MMRHCRAAVTLTYSATVLYTLVVYCINQFVRSGVPRVPWKQRFLSLGWFTSFILFLRANGVSGSWYWLFPITAIWGEDSSTIYIPFPVSLPAVSLSPLRYHAIHPLTFTSTLCTAAPPLESGPVRRLYRPHHIPLQCQSGPPVPFLPTPLGSFAFSMKCVLSVPEEM